MSRTCWRGNTQLGGPASSRISCIGFAEIAIAVKICRLSGICQIFLGEHNPLASQYFRKVFCLSISRCLTVPSVSRSITIRELLTLYPACNPVFSDEFVVNSSNVSVFAGGDVSPAGE